MGFVTTVLAICLFCGAVASGHSGDYEMSDFCEAANGVEACVDDHRSDDVVMLQDLLKISPQTLLAEHAGNPAIPVFHAAATVAVLPAGARVDVQDAGAKAGGALAIAVLPAADHALEKVNCCSGGSVCGYVHCPAIGAGTDGCVQPWLMPKKSNGEKMTLDECKSSSSKSSGGHTDLKFSVPLQATTTLPEVPREANVGVKKRFEDILEVMRREAALARDNKRKRLPQPEHNISQPISKLAKPNRSQLPEEVEKKPHEEAGHGHAIASSVFSSWETLRAEATFDLKFLLRHIVAVALVALLIFFVFDCVCYHCRLLRWLRVLSP